MHALDVSYDFDGPAAALWGILVDFAHIERWWPTDDPMVQIEKVILEGEGIGLVRHIYNLGFPTPISERLDFLDHATRTLKLSMVGALPAGLTHYAATGRIDMLPGNRCRMVYHSDFLSASGAPDEGRAFLLPVYEIMFRGLAAALNREACCAGR